MHPNDKENIDSATNLHFNESDRVKSFVLWPYDENSSCSIKKMAEAGFFFSGNKDDEEDSATCFVCGKILDGWEATDQPWSEHKKHAPQCAFVKFGRNESELTVEEMLTLYGIVLKKSYTKKYSKFITKIRKESDKYLDEIKEIK